MKEGLERNMMFSKAKALEQVAPDKTEGQVEERL